MSEPKTVQFPWQGLLAVAVAIGGLVWYLAPLETSRPTEPFGQAVGTNEMQDVDARLWQDPLSAAYLHIALDEKGQKKCQHEEFHQLDTLKKDMRGGDFWVLPVFVPGGSYAEYNEFRLRSRRAVLEALGASGFSPKDGEHIGFIRLAGVTPGGSEIIPFEWCNYDPKIAKLPSITPRLDKPRVLILWLRDELFYKEPLSRLNQLLWEILWDAGDPPVRVLGPPSSTGLRAMLNENVNYRLSYLEGVRMLSATSTASEEALGGDDSDGKSSKDLLEAKVPGFKFERLTTADDEVSAALISELKLRDVKLTPSKGTIKQLFEKLWDYFAPMRKRHYNDDDLDCIALISEWDTFYGRMLPETFTQALARGSAPKSHSNILIRHYLRGVDGRLPGPTDKLPEKQPQRKTSEPSEATEGLNQADYLRRLARELLEEDKGLRKRGKGGIKAIGVLGTDVYDKLLVLKSLRELLPGALFFTTSLDARFGHPDEWKEAHNLIVGSPFGLTLDPDLQGRIPPFRDAYQTAFYAATLAAVDDDLSSRYSDFRGTPHIYEIGRDGPFDLTETLPKTQGKPPSKSGQPENPNFGGWFTPLRAGLVVALVILSSAALLWIARVIGVSFGSLNYLGRSSASCWPWLGVPSWMILIVASLASWLLVYLVASWSGAGAEPFAWFDGISIWPTEWVRFLVFLMAIWFLLKTHHALKENETTIQEDFDLKAPQLRITRQTRILSKQWRERMIALLSLQQWCVKCRHSMEDKAEDRVVAQPLWEHYIRAGNAKIRFLRVAPLAGLYFCAGMCLMWLLGFPPVPARGDWSFDWDMVFVISAVASSIWVTFYIADATMLNRRLIDYLIEGETEWPEKAYENLRKRWSSPVASKKPPAKKDQRLADNIAKSEVQAGKSTLDERRRPPDTILAQYLDIDLIAKRTEVVGTLIYYPFILISLLIVSRLSVFDNWTWPMPLLIVIGLNGSYAAWSAFSLRKTAEKARREALRNLNDLLIAQTAVGKGTKAKAQTARETISMIRAEQRGAFAAISRHPLIGALLLPSGGAGIWALTQYLPSLF